MAKTKQQKQQQVTQLQDKLSRSKSVILADFQGLTMNKLSALRDDLRKEEAEFLVTKNTLLDLALKADNYPNISEEVVTGPTAALFAYGDEISPIKTLVKALKDAGIGQVKIGFLGKELLEAAAINKLATLPSKLELQAKVVGVLAAPMQGMVGVLQANLRNLVYVLNQVKIQKGGE